MRKCINLYSFLFDLYKLLEVTRVGSWSVILTSSKISELDNVRIITNYNLIFV